MMRKRVLSRYIQKLCVKKVDRLLISLDETFDGINGTKNQANNAKKDNKCTPGNFIDRLVAETSKTEVKEDWEDENKSTIGETSD